MWPLTPLLSIYIEFSKDRNPITEEKLFPLLLAIIVNASILSLRVLTYFRTKTNELFLSQRCQTRHQHPYRRTGRPATWTSSGRRRCRTAARPSSATSSRRRTSTARCGRRRSRRTRPRPSLPSTGELGDRLHDSLTNFHILNRCHGYLMVSYIVLVSFQGFVKSIWFSSLDYSSAD